MSKYTEAMSSIIYTMHFRVKPKYLGHAEDKNMDLMYELAEKATPKKPVKPFVSQDRLDWACPTCGSQHISDSPLQYCCYCGQAIDWSGIDTMVLEKEEEDL